MHAVSVGFQSYRTHQLAYHRLGHYNIVVHHCALNRHPLNERRAAL